MTAMASNWKIEHRCPQCAAPVLMDEADRLLTCPFCRTRLYLETTDYFRYRVPAPERAGRDMLYLPYWRLKGASFSIGENDIQPRFIDTSILATSAAGLPHSLGVRPQVMTLKFASPEMTGRFFDINLSSKAVIPVLAASCRPTFHRAFIGETISMVYAPTYLENGRLFDALLESPLCTRLEAPLPEHPAKSLNWQVQFVATLCPRCGWDLQGERDALVLICRNCDTAWRCSGDRFVETPFAVFTAATSDALYLPFWRIKPRIEGVALKSYADLIRLANLPKIQNPAFASVPVYFWSPAFKVNPALFMRWRRQMTVFQPDGATRATFDGVNVHRVTMPAGEAEESMILTLAALVTDKRRIYPLLKDMRIAAEETLLVYHPFRVGARELIHETMQIALDRKALDYGAYL
jgi:predicted RNA-binding Zn-ribbon protein involved in translation (DUF1610 family)/DNA-directed RNA polymerase subunit RPC12/RpoP